MRATALTYFTRCAISIILTITLYGDFLIFVIVATQCVKRRSDDFVLVSLSVTNTIEQTQNIFKPLYCIYTYVSSRKRVYNCAVCISFQKVKVFLRNVEFCQLIPMNNTEFIILNLTYNFVGNRRYTAADRRKRKGRRVIIHTRRASDVKLMRYTFLPYIRFHSLQ